MDKHQWRPSWKLIAVFFVLGVIAIAFPPSQILQVLALLAVAVLLSTTAHERSRADYWKDRAATAEIEVANTRSRMHLKTRQLSDQLFQLRRHLQVTNNEETQG